MKVVNVIDRAPVVSLLLLETRHVRVHESLPRVDDSTEKKQEFTEASSSTSVKMKQLTAGLASLMHSIKYGVSFSSVI